MVSSLHPLVTISLSKFGQPVLFGASINKKAVPLFGHYCSIITSLKFSPDGRFIVSADRDFKIRVTVFPKKPLEGAHKIQSFCHGHSEFVTCLAFFESSNYPQGFLVSGSGDSTVRMWDITSGSLLHTCEVGEEAGLLDYTDKEEFSLAVTNLCTVLNGTLVVVAIRSLQGIMLLSCDFVESSEPLRCGSHRTSFAAQRSCCRYCARSNEG